MEIKVLRRLEEKNKATADEIRAELDRHKVRCINVMGSPGCGKTALLEHTLPPILQRFRCAVLEGDLYTSLDAERIASIGAPVIQLETQGACHLDASLVARGVRELNLGELDLLFIENVGNLVCPANFDLGEHYRMTVISVTEGHDKPAKYPALFTKADVIVVTKVDLLRMTDFDLARAKESIRRFNDHADIIETSIRSAPSSALINWVLSVGRGDGR